VGRLAPHRPQPGSADQMGVVETIGEIDTVYWFDGREELATVRKVVEHARLIEEVDTSYPIVLGPDGRVMDGMHRIARALLEGREEIVAVRR